MPPNLSCIVACPAPAAVRIAIIQRPFPLGLLLGTHYVYIRVFVYNIVQIRPWPTSLRCSRGGKTLQRQRDVVVVAVVVVNRKGTCCCVRWCVISGPCESRDDAKVD